ncbi:MAG: Cof-type HAD-IIB family hydrolase [Spirochaetaceae bacterium]|jgi:Cof subfamily protein (haloacid dehalogenase superfamily)|nr:Cof-type HAD-IIB family hydrolase [Spirochaetaceae bacterium]
MKIELLAFDLDGTVLDNQQQISPANKSALAGARDAGIQMVPCTGRSLSHLADSLVFLFNELGFEAFPYIITDNGAQAYSLPGREQLFTVSIDEKTSLDILEESRTYRAITYCSFGAEGGTDNRGAAWEDGTGQAMLDSYSEKWYLPVVDIEPLIRWNCGAVKFTLNFHDNDEFMAARKKFSRRPDLSMAFYDHGSLEITVNGIHKGTTLRLIAEHAGIPMDRIMAIGDNYNDMEMVGDAGWGVAMGNAVAALKEKAAWVTAANDKDGLALAVRKMLAEREA